MVHEKICQKYLLNNLKNLKNFLKLIDKYIKINSYFCKRKFELFLMYFNVSYS